MADNYQRGPTDRARQRNRRIGRLIGGVLRLWGSTLRVKWHGDEQLLAAEQRGKNGGRGALFAVWHGNLLVPAVATRDRGYVVLVSRSADGEVAAAAMEAIGWQTRRGSQFWGSTEVLRSTLKALRAGAIVAVTPDGPRGPRHVAAEGSVFVAARSGCELFPVGIAAQGRYLKTWDTMLLPRPFGRAVIVIGEPVELDDDVARSTLRLQHAIEACDAQAAMLLKSKV